MVSNDNIDINIRFNTVGADGLSKVSNDIKVFKSGVEEAKGSVDGFDRVIQKFSVQTFAQGLLNISTSAAQVYTSMSNLDRAANQVQSSLVALHKAEDQIERKQIQLSKAIDQYGVSSEKAAMISDELATAHEQLEVKTERHRLAVDQLRDTQILMVSNLVNTGFGALQTIASLHSMVSLRLKQNTAETIINTSAKAVQNNVVGASGAPFAVLNGAITANTAVNRVNMFSQIGLGAAVRANPLMLPLTLATIAVGIGSTIMVMNEMGKTTERLTKDMNSSTNAVNDLGGSFSGNLGSVTSFNSGLQTGTTAANDYADALLKVKEAEDAMLESMKKRVTRSPLEQMFMSEEDKKREAEDKKREQDNIDLLNKKADMIKQQGINKQLIANTLFKTVNDTFVDPIELLKNEMVDKKWLDGLNQMGDSVERFTQEIMKSGRSYEESFTIAFDAHKESISLYDISKDQLRQLIDYNKKLNDTKDNGYKNEKQHLKEIAELKKKLSLEYGFTKPGRNRRSFVEGETGYYTGKESVSFAGIINKKTYELMIASKQRRDFIMLDNALESSKSLLNSGRWNLENVRDYMSRITNKINSTRNFIGGGNAEFNKVALNITSLISREISASRASGVLRDITSFSFGGNIINPNAQGRISSTIGQYFRERAAELSAGRITPTNPLGAIGRKAGGTESVAFGGISSKGRSSKHGGANRADQYNAQMAYNRAVAGMEGVSELTGIPLNLTATFPAERGRSYRPIYHFDDLYKRIAEANARVSLGNQIMGLGGFDPDVIGTDIYKIDSVQLASFLSREKAQVITQSEKLKMSQESVISLRSSYYGHDELLDRTRFVDKLAQISTGATVL